jgi:hypothetical protein
MRGMMYDDGKDIITFYITGTSTMKNALLPLQNLSHTPSLSSSLLPSFFSWQQQRQRRDFRTLSQYA